LLLISEWLLEERNHDEEWFASTYYYVMRTGRK
jgi:hypothetical protein